MNKKERQIAYSAILGFIDNQGTLKRVTEALSIDCSVARMEVAQEYFQKLGVDFTGLNTSGDWVELLDEKERGDIFDWNQVADGVIVAHTNAASPFLFSRYEHFPFGGLRFDTEHWNAWRAGECPFGQPDAVWIEAEDRHGAIRSARADFLDWPNEVMIYRVEGLVAPWRYPE